MYYGVLDVWHMLLAVKVKILIQASFTSSKTSIKLFKVKKRHKIVRDNSHINGI